MPEPQAKLTNLEWDEVSGVDHPAHMHEGWLVMKQLDENPDLDAKVAALLKDAAAALEPEGGNMSEQDKKDLEARVAELEKARTDAEAATATEKERADKAETEKAELEAKLVKATEDPDADPITKALADESVPESIKVILKAERESREKAEKDTAEALDIAKSERETRVRKEYVEKAKGLTFLAVNAEEFGDVLHKLFEKAPDEAAKVEQTLQAANDTIGKSRAFAVVGSNASGPDSAYGKLKALAKARVAANLEKSEAEAFDAAVQTEEGAALYAEYRAEKEAS